MSDQFPLPVDKSPGVFSLDLFGVRAQTVLKLLKIDTMQKFLLVSWPTVECWQLGNKTRKELAAIST